MAKNKLTSTEYFDFKLIGIVSTVKEYKLAWNINQLAELQLAKQPDISIEFSGNSRILISNFSYSSEHTEVTLLRNRLVAKANSKFQFLLDEVKQFDYLLKFKDETEQADIKDVLSLLKSASVIDYAAILEPSLIKSRDNLIF